MTDGEIRAIRSIRKLIDEYRKRSDYHIAVGEHAESEYCLSVVDDLRGLMEDIVNAESESANSSCG